GNTMIAREGGMSGIGGRNWAASGLGSAELALNNLGGWIHSGTLAGDAATDNVILSNSGLVIQEGDTLAAIGGVFTFTGFGTGPVDLDDSGNSLWFGDWNDPDTSRDTGLFLNHQLLVQEGVTLVDGVLLQSLSSVQDAFSMSDNGQFIIFEGTLANGNNGAFLITIPEPTNLVVVAVMVAVFLRRRCM
ncbi:MAG TPA: hypothetical protein VIY86_06695, partial [Pirellulaceae bacterium]